jgi:hypothetical protein
MMSNRLPVAGKQSACNARESKWFWLPVAIALLMACAGAKNISTLPKLVVHAKYILITTYQGDDLSSPRVYPEDREAVVDVEDALRKWGQYIVVNGTSQKPDLVLLVRKGRVADAGPSVRIHAGSTYPTSVTPGAGGDVGSSQDMLTLYEGPGGIDQPPLWRSMESGGLDPPDMQLVQKLRAAVEAAAKVP